MSGRAILIGAMTAWLAGCRADPDANPALRCGAADDCLTGQLCHAGFCIDDGTPDQQADPIGDGDDDARDASLEDGMADAGSAGAEHAGGSEDEDDDGEDGSGPSDGDEPFGGPSCQDGLCCVAGLTPCSGFCVELLSGVCCTSDELACDGMCVDPEKNEHHCGGCGNDCGDGKCKDGSCEEDS